MPDTTDRITELEVALQRLALEEQRYRCLVETTNAVVWGTNTAGADGPSSWSRYTGQTVDEHAGLGWLDALHPDDRERVGERWAYSVEHAIPYEAEYRVRRPDGSWSTVMSRAVPLWTEDGTVREWVGSVQDLTALRKSERDAAERLTQLEEAQRRLVAQERLAAVGELSAAVAHEVRNPLGAIFNALNILRRQMTHPMLDVLMEESDRVNRIVSDLVDFARPCEPKFSGESIGKVIQQALQSVDPESRGIKLQLQLTGEVDQLPMDGRLVRQLLINLFENAVQAMPAGGRLNVRTERTGDALRLFVADNGPGVPSHLRERVFAPFFTTKARGTGLGLAVVKRIAESHGGSVMLEPAYLPGAQFRVEIPLG